jgi:membrane protease YdiL (CAAX protease family)
MMEIYCAYAARGRNDWWRYLAVPVLGLLLTTLVLTAVTLVLMFAHLLPPGIAAEMQQPRNIAPFYLGIAVSFGLLTACLALAAFWVQGKRPSDIIGQWRWRLFVLGAGVWLGVQTVLTLIDLAIAPGGFSLSIKSGTGLLAVTALVGILVQTFTEEFIFRGYVTQGLVLAIKKPLPTAIVSGILFGALHIPNGLPQALNAAVFGIVCALIAMRTGGIALTFGLHLANNYFGAVIVVSGSDVFKGSPGIVTQTTPQLLWWDVGLGTLALIGMLWLVLRRAYFSAAPAS